MRKTLLSLSLAAVTLTACATDGVTVRLTDLTSDTIIAATVNAEMSAVERTDTLVAKDRVFTIAAQSSRAARVMLTITTAQGRSRLSVYTVPGENGTLAGTSEHSTWTGTKFYTDLAQIEATTDPIENEMSKLSDEFSTKVKAGASRDSLAALLQPKFEALGKQVTEARTAFVKANPASGVSVTLLTQLEDAEPAYNALAPEALNGPFAGLAASVKKHIDKAKARKEAAKLVAEGCMAPDFTLNDINGKPLALSSLRGKYVILDFWGSWCGWCIKGMPKMKEYYKKYAGKFEILGVDCNDTEAKWKAAVEKHQLPWKHVYCPKGSDVLTRYAIEGFPTKIVVGPDGKIVKTIVGEDPQFYTLLDALMK